MSTSPTLHMRPRFSLLFILLLMFNMTAARAAANSLAQQATLAGSYMLDIRPHALLFLTIAQDGSTLSGSVLMASPDGHGGTVNTIASLSGTLADNTFTLAASQQAGGLVLNGRIKNGSAEVTVADKAGANSTLPLNAVSQALFNKTLASWSRQMAKTYAAEKKASQSAAADKPAAAAAPSASAVANAAIPSELQAAEAALTEAKRSLAALGKSLDTLKREAAVKPMACPQAADTIGAIYAKEMGSAYKKDFGGSIGALRRALMHLQKLVAHADDSAQSRQARGAIPGWKTQENSLVAEANGIMKEAKAIVAAVQATPGCA